MIVVTNEQDKDKLIDKEFEPGDNEACCHVTVSVRTVSLSFGAITYVGNCGLTVFFFRFGKEIK